MEEKRRDLLSLLAHMYVESWQSPSTLHRYTVHKRWHVIDSGVGEGRLVVDSQVLFFYCHTSPFSI